MTEQTRVHSQLREPAITEKPSEVRKKRRVKRKAIEEEFTIASIPGVKKLILSEETQKLLSLRVGEHVTSENPWTHVPKDTLEYDVDVREDVSEFVPFQEQILKYTRDELLIGYIPDETRDYDEFYVCISEEAEDVVTEIIKKQKEAHDERLKRSVVKQAQSWSGYGSEAEIDSVNIKQNRLMLRVELEAEYPLLGAHTYMFRLDLIKNLTSNYVDLLPLRTNFTNVAKKFIPTGTQVALALKHNTSQTSYRYPKNISTQYQYELEFAAEIDQEALKKFRKFVENDMDKLDEYLKVNSHIDFYFSDYQTIVHDEKTTQPPGKISVKEFISISYLNLPRGMGICGLVWHPMLSATMAVWYSYHPQCVYRTTRHGVDYVDLATFKIPPVLIWSFVDILYPSLILETPSEITCLEFCPYDGNLLVGGCSSGQVILWDLTGKLKKAETHEMLNSDQIRYREFLNSHMGWMKDTRNSKIVRETVLSDLSYSHSAPVSSIMWLDPFSEITKCGKTVGVPEGDPRIIKQFTSCGRDGNVLAWDVHAKPTYTVGGYRPQRKSKRVKIRPAALSVDVSPYRVLHRVWRPTYHGTILIPGTTRSLSLTAHSHQKRACTEYVETHSNPNRKYSFFNRIPFKPILTRHDSAAESYEFVAGSAEGDCLAATWEGYEVPTGEAVSRESCKITNIGKYHDGPVVCVTRSTRFPDLILTVGGNVFVIWHIDYFEQPVVWRRSPAKYTHGTWYNLCPSIVRLTRADGVVELWDFGERSNQPKAMHSVSSHGLTCTVTQSRKISQNYFALGDERGTCRIFLLSRTIANIPSKLHFGTYNYCQRERTRKKELTDRLRTWRTSHPADVQVREERLALNQQKMEVKLHVPRMSITLQDDGKQTGQLFEPPKPGKYSEYAQQKWTNRERKRMNKYLQENKGYDLNVLDKQRKPLFDLQMQQHKKDVKRQIYTEQIESSLATSVNVLFPDAVAKPPPPIVDPYAYGDTLDAKAHLYETYVQTEKICSDHVQTHSFAYTFNWQKILNTGKIRRRILDGYKTRYTHDLRFLRERAMSREQTSIHEQTGYRNITLEVDSFSWTSERSETSEL